MGRTKRVCTALLVTGLLSIGHAAGAITFGQLDGDTHPSVGAVVMEVDDTLIPVCTGTLVAADVFLTAAHCVEDGQEQWVSFDSTIDQDATLLSGTADAHDLFASGGANNPHDIAVIVLDEAVSGISPAVLPEEGVLDDLQADHVLDDQTFTAVGYGAVRDDKRGGPHALRANVDRRYALQSPLSLQPAWLLLSMQPSTGDGGTCYGDSGGPHFLGDETSDLLASITITGDTVCRATDQTYRLDTPWVIEFLAPYV